MRLRSFFQVVAIKITSGERDPTLHLFIFAVAITYQLLQVDLIFHRDL